MLFPRAAVPSVSYAYLLWQKKIMEFKRMPYVKNGRGKIIAIPGCFVKLSLQSISISSTWVRVTHICFIRTNKPLPVLL